MTNYPICEFRQVLDIIHSIAFVSQDPKYTVKLMASRVSQFGEGVYNDLIIHTADLESRRVSDPKYRKQRNWSNLQFDLFKSFMMVDHKCQ